MLPRRRVLQIAVAVGTVLLILYGAMKASITSFTYSFAPSIPSDTVIPLSAIRGALGPGDPPGADRRAAGPLGGGVVGVFGRPAGAQEGASGRLSSSGAPS